MKRIFALILAVTMMLALAACGNSAPAESASEGESKTANSTNVQTKPLFHFAPMAEAVCPIPNPQLQTLRVER